MIERVSRYFNGPLAQTQHKYTDQYVISVFRKFPESKEVNYINYVWKDGDSLARISETFGIGAKYWWEILEINPEIDDPFGIVPGTTIRVPYGQ